MVSVNLKSSAEQSSFYVFILVGRNTRIITFNSVFYFQVYFFTMYIIFIFNIMFWNTLFCILFLYPRDSLRLDVRGNEKLSPPVSTQRSLHTSLVPRSDPDQLPAVSAETTPTRLRLCRHADCRR